MNRLPWRERVVSLQVNPESCRIAEIRRMAVELVELWAQSGTCPLEGECSWRDEAGNCSNHITGSAADEQCKHSYMDVPVCVHCGHIL